VAAHLFHTGQNFVPKVGARFGQAKRGQARFGQAGTYRGARFCKNMPRRACLHGGGKRFPDRNAMVHVFARQHGNTVLQRLVAWPCCSLSLGTFGLKRVPQYFEMPRRTCCHLVYLQRALRLCRGALVAQQEY